MGLTEQTSIVIEDSIFFLAATTTGAATTDGGSYSVLLFYIGIALGISFLCSVLEAVLLSTSLSHVEMIAQNGGRAGLLMRRYKDNVELAISAILTLNTIAHTVGAAGAGAEAAAIFGNQWIGIISAILTLLILIFSEIIPKTLGAVYWKQIMPFAAYATHFLVIVLFPMVWLFQRLTNLMAPDQREPTVTRSELEILARVSTQEGALKQGESLILRNLLTLDGVQVQDVMTPRTVLFMLEESDTVGDVVGKHKVMPYSRIPIYNESPDDIARFVLRYEILQAATEDQATVTMGEMARPIQSVPETLSLAKALEKFMTEHEHIFLVFDEYGGTAGIITLEDAIESLLGVEITDESDPVADMQELARKRLERYTRLVDKAS